MGQNAPVFNIKNECVWFEHVCTDGQYAGWSLPNMIWHITDFTYLTVTPSVHCNRCNLRGWIRQGKWVTA